jgi:hypothetical protein
MVLMDAMSKSEHLQIEENLSTVSVGLEPLRFQPVIEKLV